MYLYITKDFPSLCVEYIFMLFFTSLNFIDLLKKLLLWSSQILFCLQLDPFKILWKTLVIVIPFLSFKGITHAYLLKISITHNKNLNPLVNLLIKFISARSAPQILSLKNESNFLFLNFLIIGLCDSSANSLLDIISFLIALPDVSFYQKFYKPLKKDRFDIHHVLDF